MSVNVLVDMNLSPDWISVLQRHGWSAVHWSTVGDPRATDRTIMDWAVANNFIVFTHDLDFGTLLALTHAAGPSVLQIRGEDVLPNHMENLVIAALHQHDADLAVGALVVVDESKFRVRALPLMRIHRPRHPGIP
jgi:predicted nuclease of predicted toxin-antitoxin system